MAKDKVKLIKITKLKVGDKKYSAEFEVTKASGKISKKTIKFGGTGMPDFTTHKNIQRRERYISLHKKDLKTGDPTRAGFLSIYTLWNKPSFSAGVEDYKKRLNSYNKTGKFPTKITGSKLLKFGTQLSNIPFEKTSLKVLPPDIQRKIEKDVIKSNLDAKLLKMKLKNFLSNVRDQNVSKRNLPLHKVLDLTDKNTIVYLKLAAKVLKRSDFTPNSLWLKVILDLLDKIESDGLPPFSGALIDPFDQLKIFFKDMFNLSFDYDDDRGVWFGGIYEKRKGWDIVNDISNDEFIKLITYN
jgi:hypothetical protein